MMRRLPRDYLRREARIARGIRERDAAAVTGGMRDLGYLPGNPGDWNDELLLKSMGDASWWLQGDEPRRLSPEDLWRSTELLRSQAGSEYVAQLRRMSLPPEALLVRRMEGLLFQTAAMLRASAPWGRLMRELTEGGEPVGALGAQHAEWLARRHGGSSRRRDAAMPADDASLTAGPHR